MMKIIHYMIFFYMKDNELNKIVDLCEDIYCFYSDNDPYVNIDKAMQFAKLINGKGILIKNAEHFNEKSLQINN